MASKRLFLMFLFFVPKVINGAQPFIVTTDELENYISPEDIEELLKFEKNPVPNATVTGIDNRFSDTDEITPTSATRVDCFGLGALQWMFDMKPDPSEKINTQFYFSSRLIPQSGQVFPGNQFGLEWVDFKPNRKTVIIIHGFMSHSKASWVTDMTKAFLQQHDINVIAVDWSAGSSTFKYWKAVANTRRVGSDISNFLQQLKNATGARYKDFHIVGHSLGAHIASYASNRLGGVGRITGLDPAQPCFSTTNRSEILDETDADYVDVIHTNGRHMSKIGLGVPHPIGHADFYPNGGMRQPGCSDDTNSAWYHPSRILQAICSHGRAYILFTESLILHNCSFVGHRWNLTYEGVNSSIAAACQRRGDCAEMGINAAGGKGSNKAMGPYFVLTTNQPPYCPTEVQRSFPGPDLLSDLLNGFRMILSHKHVTPANVANKYADPLATENVVTTTEKSWFRRLLGKLGKK